MNIAIHKASPEDVDDFVSLFLLSAPFFLYPLGSRGGMERVLQKLFPQRNHLLSFQHTHFIVVEGVTAGMALGYSGITRKQQGRRTGFLLGYFLGWQLIGTWPFWISLSRATEISDVATYYLSNIAVYPDYQKRGLGKRLLAFMEDKARAAKARSIALDVEEKNTPAIALYETLGYRITGEKVLECRERRLRLYRMVKDLGE